MIAAACSPSVTYDADRRSILVNAFAVDELVVVSEARRWSTGTRGEAVDEAGLVGADLTNFVTQALRIGAGAITSAGHAQDTFDLERLVEEVGTRTANASNQAAALTSKAVTDAGTAMAKASELAKKAMEDAGSTSRKTFEETVSTAQKRLREELQRLFGGESPELLDRLQPILEKFGSELDSKVAKQTTELLSRAAKQFDPTDPTSPMAKHAAELTKQQEVLATTLAKNHEAVVTKVDALTTAVSVQAAAQQTSAKLASVSPLKGITYAEGVHAVMQEIAAGLGDEYADTGAVAGRTSGSWKGDGVLTVGDSAARVVLEMTDSKRVGWHDYLDESERNRDAAASLGLVRNSAQNAGQSIRVLGSRRIVMAFDPMMDDPNLLRTVVLLLRTTAIAATSRRGVNELATAEEKVQAAIELLAKIDGIQKAAGAIHKSATKISSECTSFASGIERLLTEALAALAGVEAESPEGPAESQLASGAA